MGRHTIEVCHDVSVEEFCDDVILEAALGVIERHRKVPEPDKGLILSRIYDLWFENEKLMQRIAAALGVDMQSDLPPASTAARIKSLDDLRAFAAKSKLFSPAALE